MALLGPTPGMGFMGAFFVVWLIVMLAVYVYFALALMFIAKKKNTKNAWLAWIPIANVYLMTQVAGVPAWWTLAVLLPIIPFIGGLAMMVVMVYLWWKIAEAIGKPGWWGILLIVPIVNFVIIGIMAWGK
ncbi:hypothetical protein KY349_03040 [Candidatus Woesearchaeota archaeon]|jgi:hypothetical protein|nr:hypothetical protein [Candidatus Woesearchaeota archaeon]